MRSYLIILTAVLALAGNLFAQQPVGRLKVGVYDKPPFAMKKDGRWVGLGVSVWEKISEQMKLSYDYVEVPEDTVIDKLVRGEIDVIVGEITVSAEHARLVDFTQPYVVSSAAVALKRGSILPHVTYFLEEFVQHGFWPILFSMIGTLLAFSFLLWLVERRVHQGHFGGRPLHGFGSALWFSAVTMTTVGYGDKTPQSLVGRVLAFFWMFFGIILVGAFTATVASSVAVSRVNSTVHTVSDLAHFRNGVMGGSMAESYLNGFGIPTQPFESVESGMQALEDGKITAFVGNDITLRYLVNHYHPGKLEVEPFPSIHVTFAFAARPNFPLFKEMGICLLDQVDAPDWHRRLQKWIGPIEEGN